MTRPPVLLETGSLRQVALNGGRATKALSGPDYIGLVNGDQIPGRIAALDADTVTIDTPLGETLTVERNGQPQSIILKTSQLDLDGEQTQ